MSGNLPPGVSASDIDRHYGRSDPHDHEFRIEDGSDYTVDCDGDYYYVSVQCLHRPLLDSVTDTTRDETYEEYGDRCGAQKQYVYEMVSLHVSDPYVAGHEAHISRDEYPDVWGDVLHDNRETIEETLVNAATTENDEIVVSVEYQGDDGYELTLELDETNVYEG